MDLSGCAESRSQFGSNSPLVWMQAGELAAVGTLLRARRENLKELKSFCYTSNCHVTVEVEEGLGMIIFSFPYALQFK